MTNIAALADTRTTPTSAINVPDATVNAREAFGIDLDMQVPSFSVRTEHVPDIDSTYKFDRETTLAIAAGFAFNRRVMIQGYHGTGKSTHIEQVAARLNWPCIRVNLDSHISRIDLIGEGRDRPEGRQADHGVPRGDPALGVAACLCAGVRRVRCRAAGCDVRDPAGCWRWKGG